MKLDPSLRTGKHEKYLSLRRKNDMHVLPRYTKNKQAHDIQRKKTVSEYEIKKKLIISFHKHFNISVCYKNCYSGNISLTTDNGK